MEEQQLDLTFPFFGVDLSQGQFNQRPGTTPLGINVRSYDTNNRKRGGTRPGLTPYFGRGDTAQVAGFHKIQSLTPVVWCSQAATFNSAFVLITLRMDYNEADHPPARDAPTIEESITWYEKTSPNVTGVTGIVVGIPDGGGTGKGTASFKVSQDGVNVTLLATFISAGFPGPYAHSDAGPIQTITQSEALFFNPVTSRLAGNWTVVAGSFIANYIFNVFFPGP